MSHDKVVEAIQKKNKAIEKKNVEIRKNNCNSAQKRLAIISAGGRLYEVDDKGERSYWDDATLASKKAKAQAQVDEWCK